MIKLRRMRWAGRVTYDTCGKYDKRYGILMVQPEGKRPFGKA